MKKITFALLCAFWLTGCSVDPLEELDDYNVQSGAMANTNKQSDTEGCGEWSAGDDNEAVLTYAEAEAIPDLEQLRNTYLDLLDEGVSRNGSFEPSMAEIGEEFDDHNSDEVGYFTTTYVLAGDQCTDTVDLTIKVVPYADCTIDAGEDNSTTITVTEAESIADLDALRMMYLDLLEEDVSREGTFNPSIEEISQEFEVSDDETGEYTLTYTVGEENCSDAVDLTIFVTPDPVCTIDAGEDRSTTITQSEAESIADLEALESLYTNMLEEDVSEEGTFSPTMQEISESFETSDDPVGEYSTVYTVGEGDCTDSVVLTVNIIPNPVCTIDAGEDSSVTITVSQAESIDDLDALRRLYVNMLEENVSTQGTFSPTFEEISESFENSDDPVGEYSTVYTVGEGDCTDSVALTVNIIPNPDCAIDAGENNSMTITVAEGEAIEDLDALKELYLTLLDEGVSRDGTFDPSIRQLSTRFERAGIGQQAGNYTTTYTITEGDCTDSVELTIRVVD